LSSEHEDRAMRVIQAHSVISGALLRLVDEKKLMTKPSVEVCPLCGAEGKGIVFGSINEDKPYFSFCEACCGMITMHPAWVEGVVKRGMAVSEGLKEVIDVIKEKARASGGKVLAFGLGAFPVQRVPRVPKQSCN